MRRSTAFSAVLSALLVSALAAPLGAQGVAIGFEEDFALARDREAVLKELVPGSQEAYFYRCLHLQNERRLDAVPPLLAEWIERYGRSPRVEEIENRQLLLDYERDPSKTFEQLQQRLGLRFDHQREDMGARPDLPTRLDPALLEPAALYKRALELHPLSLDGVRDRALPGLAATELDATLLHDLLRRLERPDVPGLAQLVVRDLERSRTEPFGSLELHGKLLLEQLEECAELRPALLDSDAFVAAWIVRLQPSADVDWRRDPRARLEYLTRLEEFVNRLSPAHGSLKAHVLYHRLAHDLGQGAPDKPRFVAYLRLPRNTPSVNRERFKGAPSRDPVVDLNRDYPTGLGPVHDDEPVVRAWLEHFFREEDSWEPYTEFLDEAYVRKLFAETKLLAGQGDLERWTALVDDAGWLEALRQRVEIQFAPTQPPAYRADEPVSVDVDVKNVDTLLVKVFEIDAFNYYRAKDEEVDQSIQIDGLVPNVELTETYKEGPMRRVRRHIDLPQLSKPGVYVVELIGNGLSSRAVIRKGALKLLDRDSSAGHVLRILDEQGRAQPDATLWLGGREYAPDERGEIVVPYTTESALEHVVLKRGELAALARLYHREEQYSLSARAFVEREALLPGRKAKLVVRPTLGVNVQPIRIELLEEPRLQLISTDGQGTKSSQEVRDLELTSSGELVHEFQVPEGLRTLEVVLRGKLRAVSRGEDVELESNSTSFTLNQIDTTSSTTSPFLGQSDRGWHLDLLGRNGEPKGGRAVTIDLELRDYVDALQVTLRTDERGRLELGSLEAATRIGILGAGEEFSGGWELPAQRHTLPGSVHGVAGQTLRVPYVGKATSASRSAVSLIELRADQYAHDAFDHIAIRDGFVELTGLAPGDYELWLPESAAKIGVRITAGEVRDRWAFGAQRWLELSPTEPLQIVDVRTAGGELAVRLANATERSRVHVIASRYVQLPMHDPFDNLWAPYRTSPARETPDLGAASYESGRQISDEYRYILERRFARRFPGNMLSRPGLLLNPWSLAESLMPTSSGPSAFSGRRAGGGGKGRAGGMTQGGAGGRGGAGDKAIYHPASWFVDVDFLPDPAQVLTNLRAGADGVVHIPLANLGSGPFVQVVAIDGDTTAYSTLALPEKPLVPLDRRLMRPLDPARHFAEQEQIVRVEAGASSTIEDVGSSKAESYDSLRSVFRLFRTLSGMEELDRFEFLTRWPGLTREAKLELYSKHACHELHFFLWNKDPQFFAEVVKPYLMQKVHKTFLDHWLLEDDLTRYLEPAAFARLNTVERILLTGRVPNRREDGARQLREAVELLPRDPERARRLFEAALAGAALDTDSTLRSELAANVVSAPSEPPAAPETAAPQAAQDSALKAEAARLEQEMELERERRSQVAELYRAPDPTKSWAESNYWKLPIERQDAALVRPNAFWLDYAAREPGTPFLSTHFNEAAGTLTEMLLALSVLDLPFQAGEHAIDSGENTLTLRAATPLLLVRREIHAATPLEENEPPLLLSQNLLRLDDRWRTEDDGQQREAYVTGELTVDVPYACQVVATNPTSARRRLDLLLQIPEGAMPLGGGARTKSVEVELGAYSTKELEYSFYFPSPGSFRHYPVHASSDGAFVAAAPAITWTVVAVPTVIDTTSWQHVSQLGSETEVFDYLERANLQRIDLSKLAWRMQERPFFERLLALMRRRLVYQPELWSYGIRHHDADATREYLAQRGDFLYRCGRWLESPLASIDPIERRDWQLLEFEPLFNARAHPFGGRREVADASLASHYLALLDILAYRPALDDVDHMAVTYYLLLQDRIADALAQFEQIDPSHLASRIQYDYMRAYMDFFSDEHAVAREVAVGYRDYPVKRWRERFAEVVRQLDEAAGAAITGAGTDDRTRRQTELASAGPSLELGVEGRRVRVGYANLASCEVRYYPLDVEFQFSTSPFARNDGDAALFVRPRRSDTLALAKEPKEILFDLPAELAGANLMVEVRGGGLVRRQAAYASTLDVQTFESYGQLAVKSSDSGAPLSKVYVKVYARSGLKERFYKDGYTDLRGRFDYASLSEEDGDKPDHFAILVLSDTQGAALREVAAPLK